MINESKVVRYEPSLEWLCIEYEDPRQVVEMNEDREGTYVTHDDYKALEDECERLRARVAVISAEQYALSNEYSVVKLSERTSKIELAELKAREDKASRDGFYNAICFVLGHMNGIGDNGSTVYEEILRACGEDEVIAYARKNGEMRFTGLSRYLRFNKS